MKSNVLKMFVLAAVFSTAAVSVVSCSKDDNKKEAAKEMYDGNYEGVILRQSQEAGKFKFTVGKDLKLEGTLTYRSYPTVLKGSVSDKGEITAEFSSNNQKMGDFKGNISNGEVSGKWIYPMAKVTDDFKGKKVN